MTININNKGQFLTELSVVSRETYRCSKGRGCQNRENRREDPGLRLASGRFLLETGAQPGLPAKLHATPLPF